MKANNRISWIDICRGICIFCVVISHTKTCPDVFRYFFSPFYMPMFFFLSGVVFRPSLKLQHSIINIITKLLWPYVISVIILTVVRLRWVEALIDSNYNEFFNFFHESFSGLFWGKTLWFLPCIFLVQITASIIIFLLGKKKTFLAIINMLCLLYIFILNGEEIAPWSANTAIFALGYFILGYLLQNKMMNLSLSNRKRILGPISLIIYSVILYFANTLREEPFYFDMHCNRFSSSPEWFLLFSIMGIFVMSIFAMSLKKQRFIEFIGASSLIIYIYHGYSGFFGRNLLNLISISEDTVSAELYTLIYASVSVLIACVFSIIINKYFPILIGRSPLIDKLFIKFK